jgi:hypothetical protein
MLPSQLRHCFSCRCRYHLEEYLEKRREEGGGGRRRR